MKLTLFILLLPIFVFAHPGKTDANGCHTNKKTGEYHCHGTGKPAKAPVKTEKSNFENVTLISVHDGDTFKVSLPCSKDVLCQQISVRVRGIDTAEIDSKDTCEKSAAKAAKQFTRQFLDGGKINLQNCERDKYFRLLCDVKVNNKDLASALIKENKAVKYDGSKKKSINWCAK